MSHEQVAINNLLINELFDYILEMLGGRLPSAPISAPTQTIFVDFCFVFAFGIPGDEPEMIKSVR